MIDNKLKIFCLCQETTSDEELSPDVKIIKQNIKELTWTIDREDRVIEILRARRPKCLDIDRLDDQFRLMIEYDDELDGPTSPVNLELPNLFSKYGVWLILFIVLTNHFFFNLTDPFNARPLSSPEAMPEIPPKRVRRSTKRRR